MSSQVVVIGGGVIGLSVALKQVHEKEEVILIEENSYLGHEISSRNSGVIHSGIYYPKNSLKSLLCIRGNDLLYEYCNNMQIPFKKLGKLIFTDKSKLTQLESLYNNGTENGVTGLKLLDRRGISSIEPELNADYAIFSQNTGIIDVHSLINTLSNEFEMKGGLILKKTRFCSAEIHKDKVKVKIQNPDDTNYEFLTDILVNCSGLFAEYNSNKVQGLEKADIPIPFHVKGNYFFYAGRNPFKHLIYPIPPTIGLDIHSTSDMEGRLKFGPDTDFSSVSLEVDNERKSIFLEAIRNYWPSITEEKLMPDYVGIRPKIKVKGEVYSDFLLKKHTENYISLYGIESPGLTACLAIGEEVYNLTQ